MFEHARHFPSRRRHARDRHDRMPIYLQDFVRPIINHGIARNRAPIARDQHATGKLKRQNRGRLCRFPRSLARIWRACSRIDRRRRTEQPFAPQQRGKIFARARKTLLERHQRRFHYWPVRWR